MKAWMRELIIIFTSTLTNRRIVIGSDNNALKIVVSGTKYLSALKDECTIQIENLTAKEITELINEQFYDVEVQCGYKSAAVSTIFKGGVRYFSNVLGDRKSNTLYAFCASSLVAKYGQSRMNLSLASGINMYNLLTYICEKAKIPNSNVDEQFKYNILQVSTEQSKTVGNILEGIASNNNYIINSDFSSTSTVSIWSPSKDSRIIKVEPSTIILTAGYPTLNTEGLHLSLMPTFNFIPGDVIQIDNSIVDTGMSSYDANELNRGYYLDKNGQYVIFQIDFELENRGSNFSLNMLAKSKSLISKMHVG